MVYFKKYQLGLILISLNDFYNEIYSLKFKLVLILLFRAILKKNEFLKFHL